MMMRYGLISVVLFLALPVASLAGDNEDLANKLKSRGAKKALLDYDRALSKARNIFETEVETARKKLLVDLEAAQEKAAKANELDDAILIRDIRNGIEESREPPRPNGNSQIIAAYYGNNVSWIDVTDKIRQATKGETKWTYTVDTQDLGEPAPGWNQLRVLIVRYSVGRKIMFKAVWQGKVITLP